MTWNTSQSRSRMAETCAPRFHTLILFSTTLLLIAAGLVAGNASYTAAQSATLVDYDLDDDNLIEVENTDQFLAIHHDLDGDGDFATNPSNGYIFTAWDTAFPNAMPNGGCPLRDHDDDPITDDARECLGYELIKDIDFTGKTFAPLGKTGAFDADVFHGKLVGNGFRLINPDRVCDSCATYGTYYGVVARAGVGSSIEGLGVQNQNLYGGGTQHGGITSELRGTITGSYVKDGNIKGGGNVGGLAGSLHTGPATASAPAYAAKIAHSYVWGVSIDWAQGIGGLIGTWHGNTGTYMARCINSYFSGTVHVHTGSSPHGLISGRKNGGINTNCIGDQTTDDEPAWSGASSADNTNFRATNAHMIAVTDYDTPPTNNPFTAWEDYDAEGTELVVGDPRTDFWDFGDATTLPVLKAWGHDRTPARARSETSVNLCTRTLAVANEIIRLLNDSDVLSGVSPTPTPLTLTPCTSSSDTRTVTVANLTNLAVTSASNPLNLNPDRTSPASEKLTSLDTNDFAYLTNATHFDLSGNAFTTLPARLFQGIPLRWLDLSNNNLTTLPADLFAGLGTVTAMSGNALLLSGNTLTHTGIAGRVLDRLPHINALDLSDNALTAVNTRWFEKLANLGDKAATTPAYTHALGLHLGGNTISEYYYSNKLFTGVRKDVTAYVNSDRLRTAIIAAITAAAGGTTPTTLDLAETDFYFNAGGTTTGYQASSVTACLSTQTAAPGRLDYVDDGTPDCQIQPHWTPPHKSSDAATAAPTIGTTSAVRGELRLNVSHTASTSFVAYQIRIKAGAGDPWTPWLVAPISLSTGTKTLAVPALQSGAAYQVELRARSATGPPSSAASTTITPTAANWFTGLSVSTSAAPAIGSITLGWSVVPPASIPANNTILAYYYRYKSQADTIYGAWQTVPDSDDAGSSLTDETAYRIDGLDPDGDYDVQMAAGLDGADADTELDYFTNLQIGSTSALAVPTGLSATGGTIPGTLRVMWTMQTVGTTASSKLQVRRKLRSTSSWTGATWIDVPDSTGTGGDADTDAHNETEHTLTGLTGGSDYDVQVRLHRSAGDGGPLEPTQTMGTATAADAPAGLSVTAGSGPGEIDLSWTAQSATTASGTYYELRHRVTGGDWPRSGWTTIPSSTHSTNSYSFTTLNGQSIDIELRFHWNGPGTTSSGTVTTGAVGAVTGLTARPDVTAAVMSWDRQTVTSSADARYQVRFKFPHHDWPTSATMGWTTIAGSTHASDSYTLFGLPGGGPLDIEVRFLWNDTVGGGPADSVTVTPPAIPALTGVTAVPSQFPGQIDISWDAQTLTTLSSARFQVRTKWKVGGNWTGWIDIPDGTDAGMHTYDESSGSFGGLWPYRLHILDVRMAVGPSTGPVTELEQVRAGYQPQGLTATAGDAPGTIDVSWTRQTVMTHSIAQFAVRAKRTGIGNWPGVTWFHTTPGDHAATGRQISGLSAGELHDIQSTFRAANGQWANEFYLNTLTSVRSGIVQPPKNFTAATSAVAVNAIDLKWDQQTASTLAASKFQYRIKESSTAAWTTETWNDIGDGDDAMSHDYDESSFTVTEITSGTALTANTSYDVELRFYWDTTYTNSTTVAATATSSSVPPPPNFVAVPSETSDAVDLSWDTVAGITEYQYRFKIDSASSFPSAGTGSWTQVPDANSDSSFADEDELTVTGLTGGSAYDFELRADTAMMQSTAATATSLAQTRPAPRNLSATTGSIPGQIDVSWQAPSSGIPNIAEYQYRYKLTSAAESAFSTWTQVPDSDSDNAFKDETTLALTRLLGATAYDIQLRVMTTATPPAYSLAIEVSHTTSPVPPPGGFTADAGTEPGDVDLAWNAPAGITVLRYEVRHRIGDSDWTRWTSLGTVLEHTLNGLVGGSTYTVELRTVMAGAGASLAVDETVTPLVLPPPGNFAVTAGVFPGQIDISWRAVTNATGYQYRVKATTVGWPADGGWVNVADGSTDSVVIDGLAPDVQHHVQLRAVATGIGMSTIRTKTATSGDDMVTGTAPIPSGYAIAPADAPGAIKITLPGSTDPFMYRTQTANPGEWSQWVVVRPAASVVSYLITGLEPGVAYNVQLRVYLGTADGFTIALSMNDVEALELLGPSNFAVEVSSGILVLKWKNPNPVDVERYEYRRRLVGAAEWSSWMSVDHEGARNAEQRLFFTDVQSGQSYQFEIRIQVGTDTSPVASGGAISRVSLPDIKSIRPEVRELTVSAGTQVRLGVNIYNLQDRLDNVIADDSLLVFRWTEAGDGGGSFGSPDNGRSVAYTVPSSPGNYTVQAEAQPDGICKTHHEDATAISDANRAPCIAIFTVRVTRAPSIATPQPDPINPSGVIPTSMTDDEGISYTVFTPVDGGTFTGEGFTVTATAGTVPDRSLLGVSAAESSVPVPAPVPGASMSVAGSFYEVNAITTDGQAPLSDYTLDDPIQVCLPFPQEFRADLSNVVMVSRASDGALGILSTKIRTTGSELTVCGTVSALPATVGVAKLGTVPAIAPTPAPDQPPPDTGAPAPTTAALVVMLLAGALLLTAIPRISRIIPRHPKHPAHPC